MEAFVIRISDKLAGSDKGARKILRRAGSFQSISFIAVTNSAVA